MNVQSSSNGSQMPTQSLAPVKQISQSFAGVSQDKLVRAVRTEKQLQTAEFQGVKISVGEEQLIKAINRAIKALEGPSTTFEMKMHKQTNTIVVKVFNKETGELIREIPPEKTLDLVVKMMEIAGILIDEKV